MFDIKEYNRNYYQENKEHLTEYKKKYNKKYHQENRDRIREHRKEYFKQWFKQWSKTENGKAYKQRGRATRRAIYRGIINTLTSQEWLDILEAHGYKCAYCGLEFDCENLPTKDHVIPLSKGGNNTKENIVPACGRCNDRKGIKNHKEVNLWENPIEKEVHYARNNKFQ